MQPHHAIVFIGDSLDVCALPLSARIPSPDVIHLITERFSIDMVRTLRADALVKPLEASVRTFVLVARDWPSEAQNALLKLLEEPPSSAEFILVVPRADMLLPTVRSRVLLMAVAESLLQPETSEVFEVFLAAPYATRLELIATWAKDKSVKEMEQVLRGAEQYAHERAQSHPALLSTVITIREHFSQSGAARKMLLEELALSLPVR